MRVCVTGATSLIGRRLAQELSARGDEVRCLQRREPAGLDVDVVRGDIRDGDAVDRALRGCDAVVHLAARVGVVGSWEDFRSTNVDGTRLVLDGARRHGAGDVVYVSSPSVAHAGEPLIGADAGPAITGRRDAFYAESKALAERAALRADDDGLRVVAIRPHLVWGPGDTQLVGRIVERARAGRLALVGGGRSLVDSTYIDNAVSALVAALDALGTNPAVAGSAYVVSNGEPRPIRELVEGICRAAGVPFAPRSVPTPVAVGLGRLIERVWDRVPSRFGGDDEPPLTRFVAEQLGTAHWFDQRRTRADLDWSPTVTIDEGLRRLTAHFAAAGDWSP